MEKTIDVANFAAGVRAAPGFEPSGGGAARMLNYIVNPNGELEERPGYQVLSNPIININKQGRVDAAGSQRGPLAVIDNSSGERLFFRLPIGARWIASKDKLFYTVPSPPPIHAFSARWVDVSAGAPITTANIYRWSAATDAGGDAVRPSREKAAPRTLTISGSSTIPKGISHPILLGLDATPPNSENPVEIAFRTGNTAVQKFKLAIKVDENYSGDDIWGKFGVDDTDTGDAGLTLAANKTYVWTWHGENGGYKNAIDEFGTTVANLVSDYWLWVVGGVLGPGGRLLGAAIDWLFVPDPGDSTTATEIKEMDEATYRNSYLEMQYEVSAGAVHKYRYYLYGHRESRIGTEISTALQAGLQVGATGAQVAGAFGAAAGAAVATAGVAGSILNRASEGARINLSGQSRPLSAGRPGSGFQTGQYVFCHTYSLDEERTVETLPSRTTEVMMYDFPNLRAASANRTRQKFGWTLQREDTPKSASFDWPRYINLYAARTTDIDLDDKIAQETGLDFQLIKQVALADIPTGGSLAVEWLDEELIDPAPYLKSHDNDAPPDAMSDIVSYGSRIWGVNTDDNSIRYSKLGPAGYHFFPNENTLVPQNITFDKDDSPIVKIHAGSNDSMLYVFKNDLIHVLRGHGDIRGLYSPETPVSVDLDASVQIENVGTSSPNTVTTLRNSVMFVGSDKILYNLSGIHVTPFSLSIQPYLEKLNDTELLDIFAFEYRNCYHLCLLNEVLVLDLQKKYWTVYDWALKEVVWAQRSAGDGNKVYAIDYRNEFLELYTEATDELRVVCEWESNPFKLPYQSIVSGLYVFRDFSRVGKIKASLRMDNGAYQTRTYTPAKYNRFKQGFHGRGHRAQLKIRDENPEKLRIDRIQIGVEV